MVSPAMFVQLVADDGVRVCTEALNRNIAIKAFVEPTIITLHGMVNAVSGGINGFNVDAGAR